MEAHGARIERQIEHVHESVGRFEREMAGFFEELLEEQDPARFAAMAETLPEPPSFEDILPEAFEARSTDEIVRGREADPTSADAAPVADAAWSDGGSAEAAAPDGGDEPTPAESTSVDPSAGLEVPRSSRASPRRASPSTAPP